MRKILLRILMLSWSFVLATTSMALAVTATPGYLSVSGIYIPTTTVKAGAAIRVNASVKALKAKTGAKVSMEIHPTLSSGAMSSTITVSAVKTSQSFAANEEKAYNLDYTIPTSAAAGKYVFVIYVTSGDGSLLYASYTDVVAANSFTVTSTSTAAVAATSTSYLRGVNVMDPGIGEHYDMTGYTTPTLSALQALKGRGLQVIRLPIMWERMQRTLGGALYTSYLNDILQVLRDANTANIKVIVDLHNYARYNVNKVSGGDTFFGQSNGPTKAHFGNLWSRLATAIKADSAAYNAVYAYDLMNEPTAIPTAGGVAGNVIWEQYAQAAVTAIRNAGDSKLIHVEGYFYANPYFFPSNHPKAFITDSANNTMYQAHLYFDSDSSGTYANSYSYETQKAASAGYSSISAQAIARLKVFSDWCTAQKVKCFLGEFGWPNSDVVGYNEAALWNNSAELFMTYMDSIKMGGTMWTTGSWLSPTANIMNTYVLPGRNPTAFQALTQAPILERHLGK